MEQLELVAVQFDECRRLIEKGGTAHLRLALILIDSAVETIMFRKIDNELQLNHVYKEIVELAQRYPGQGDEEILTEAREKYVSKKQRHKLDHHFNQKIAFLASRGLIADSLVAGLRKLHKYRNDAYHQDKLRVDTLAPAVRIYFDMACTLLAGYYEPRPIITWKVWGAEEFERENPILSKYASEFERENPILSKYASGVDFMGILNMPRLVSDRLRTLVALDVDALRQNLIDHLRSRIDQMESELEFAHSLTLFEGWKKSDMVRMAQMLADVEKGGSLLSLEQIRGKNYPYKLSDFQRWRDETSQLCNFADRNSLFAEFGRIENDMEPCHEAVHEMAIQCDRMMQEQIDWLRGK